MMNPYQQALTKQLQVPGLQAPVDPTAQIDPPQPQTPQTPQTPQAPTGGSLQDILGRYQYGAKGLADAEGELGGAGYQLQKDAGGRVRGRLKGPTGDIIDVIGQGEGNDWWNNQTGSAWNIHNRGQEGLDAGGWSFGGGGGGMAPAMSAPSPIAMPTPEPTDWRDVAVSAGDTGQRSALLEALLAQLSDPDRKRML